jgi:predicted membrane protein
VSAAAPTTSARSRTTLGLVLIGVGLILTLDSAGVLRTGGLGRWWPLLLIGFGLVKVRQPIADGQRAAGVALLLFGGIFQAMSIIATGSFWPLLMVAFGAFLVWQGVEGPRRAEIAVASESNYVSDVALIGFMKRSHHARDFRGGSITAIMGGVELDLRRAVIADGTAFLDVVAFWGGIEVKVPADWTVDARVVPVAGAFENKVDPLAASGGPRLVLRGHAIMGAVVIGN